METEFSYKFSLYLYSAFKNKHNLVHNQSSVMNSRSPSEQSILSSSLHHPKRMTFSDFPIEIFNKICGLDYFPDFQKELEENSQVIPIVPPFYNRIWGINLSVGYIF